MEFINLAGKNAIVTGGSRGVGRSTAIMLARAGADVGITYHNRTDAADSTLMEIKKLGRKGWSFALDFSSWDNLTEYVQQVDTEFPDGLDFLVINHGIWPATPIPITEMSTVHWRRTLAINLDSVFHLTHQLGPRLSDHGRIIYVSSTAGQRGEANHVDYAASKGALISMVKGLCVEFGPRDITVNCVAPGWVDTEMAQPAYNDGGKDRIEKNIPIGRVATPDDVAGPILFLCSNLARHITGEVLNVNGGAVLCG